MARSIVTIYLVIRDVIPNTKGFNTTNSALNKRHFSAEQSTKIVLGIIFLLGLSNFVVNHFSFRQHSFFILTLLTIIIIF